MFDHVPSTCKARETKFHLLANSIWNFFRQSTFILWISIRSRLHIFPRVLHFLSTKIAFYDLQCVSKKLLTECCWSPKILAKIIQCCGVKFYHWSSWSCLVLVRNDKKNSGPSLVEIDSCKCCRLPVTADWVGAPLFQKYSVSKRHPLALCSPELLPTRQWLLHYMDSNPGW